MSTSALRGFRELRTVPNVPVDTSLLPPKRHCQKCGCVLRQSNPSDICAPCSGHVDIPDWVTAIVESDSRPHTLCMLAALVTDRPHANYRHVDCVDEIRQLHAEGCSSYEIARLCGRKRSTIQHVLVRLES